MSSIYTSLKVLKILVLKGNHLKELIMLLLDKVMEGAILGSDKGSKGRLLLLSGPKGSMDFIKIMGGCWMRGTRTPWRVNGGCEVDYLIFIG